LDAITIGGISVKPRWEGFRRGREMNGRETLVLPYLLEDDSLRENLLIALLGTVVRTGTTDFTITRTIPHKCPGNPKLFCLSAGLDEGHGELLVAGTQPRWRAVTVTATYGTPEFNWDGTNTQNNNLLFENSANPTVPYVNATCNVEEGFEEVDLPDGTFVTGAAARPVEGAKVAIPTARLTMMIKNVPYLAGYYPIATNLAGSLNSAILFGYAIGRLKFGGLSTGEGETFPGQVRTKEFTLVWDYRAVDHNMVIDTDPASATVGQFVFARRKGTTDGLTTRRYAYLNHAQLLEPALAV